MENKPTTSEATPATRNPYKLPLWVGLHVEPLPAACHDAELIWLGVAGPGLDLERAERICAARKVCQVVFQRDGVEVQTDFTDGGTFAEWIACRRDELAIDEPAFDSDAEREVALDAVRLIYAEGQRQEGGRR